MNCSELLADFSTCLILSPISILFGLDCLSSWTTRSLLVPSCLTREYVSSGYSLPWNASISDLNALNWDWDIRKLLPVPASHGLPAMWMWQWSSSVCGMARNIPWGERLLIYSNAICLSFSWSILWLSFQWNEIISWRTLVAFLRILRLVDSFDSRLVIHSSGVFPWMFWVRTKRWPSFARPLSLNRYSISCLNDFVRLGLDLIIKVLDRRFLIFRTWYERCKLLNQLVFGKHVVRTAENGS